jgi:transketolase
MKAKFTEVDRLCVNSIRCLSADLPSAASSGHPGAPLGCAPIAHILWSRHMNFSPSNPKWFNRDRFVLSNGHSCALLYVMLYLTGYDLFLDDLKAFRKLGSRTPGHPEAFVTPGVEITTGPLGQGIASAVGLAMAERHFAALFNKTGYAIFDNTIYVLVGDGCLQEGISSEASSLAGHLKLGNLVVIYDANSITIDGDCCLSFTEDVAARYQAYGWHTIFVEDGNEDFESLDAAIEESKLIEDKPVLILVKTTIGYGSTKQGTHEVHGTPLKADDLASLKIKMGFDSRDTFFVPEKVKTFYESVREANLEKERAWNKTFKEYKAKYPELAEELERRLRGDLPSAWKDTLPCWTPDDGSLATRQASQKILNALSRIIPEIVGGSADLTPSNLTFLECSYDFQAGSYGGRYIRFGIREHAMAAILNGMAAYGGLIPFGATFLNFIQYALGAVRLSALSHLRVIYVLTHDSIGLGEDGPTHQPINALVMLRAMPNIVTLRPCDGNETSGSYAVALENFDRPTVLALSRQPCPHMQGSSMDLVRKGGYVIYDSLHRANIVFVASGSEVSLCVQAARSLPFPARVVSMPSTDLFDEQPLEYKLSIIPEGVPVLSCEALSTKGWHEYSHVQHGMTTFGRSGPCSDVMNYFGFNVEVLCYKAQKTVEFYSVNPVPSLFNKPSFV